jgi:uncharacterized membrane protein YeaQ/YmgE (transglycosylase-associated protein family)
MRGSRLVLAGVLALVGGVWLGQGLGFIGGSFMTGSPFWAVVGAVLLVLAAALVAVERRRA